MARSLIDMGTRMNTLRGGLADASTLSDFTPEQMALGIHTEMEHTDDPQVALEIAMDHLFEDPEYYWKLLAMEAGMEATNRDMEDRKVEETTMRVDDVFYPEHPFDVMAKHYEKKSGFMIEMSETDPFDVAQWVPDNRYQVVFTLKYKESPVLEVCTYRHKEDRLQFAWANQDTFRLDRPPRIWGLLNPSIEDVYEYVEHLVEVYDDRESMDSHPREPREVEGAYPFSESRKRLKEGFMQPQIVHGDWWEVDTTSGIWFVPKEYSDGSPEDLLQYAEVHDVADIIEIDLRSGYGARLSAPGYMDQTEWTVFATEQEAIDYLEEAYGPFNESRKRSKRRVAEDTAVPTVVTSPKLGEVKIDRIVGDGSFSHNWKRPGPEDWILVLIGAGYDAYRFLVNSSDHEALDVLADAGALKQWETSWEQLEKEYDPEELKRMEEFGEIMTFGNYGTPHEGFELRALEQVDDIAWGDDKPILDDDDYDESRKRSKRRVAEGGLNISGPVGAYTGLPRRSIEDTSNEMIEAGYDYILLIPGEGPYYTYSFRVAEDLYVKLGGTGNRNVLKTNPPNIQRISDYLALNDPADSKDVGFVALGYAKSRQQSETRKRSKKKVVESVSPEEVSQLLMSLGNGYSPQAGEAEKLASQFDEIAHWEAKGEKAAEKAGYDFPEAYEDAYELEHNTLSPEALKVWTIINDIMSSVAEKAAVPEDNVFYDFIQPLRVDPEKFGMVENTLHEAYSEASAAKVATEVVRLWSNGHKQWAVDILMLDPHGYEIVYGDPLSAAFDKITDGRTARQEAGKFRAEYMGMRIWNKKNKKTNEGKRMTEDAGFKKWMQLVDREVQKLVGASVHDLADANFYDMYEDEMSPSQAAMEVLENDDLYGPNMEELGLYDSVDAEDDGAVYWTGTKTGGQYPKSTDRHYVGHFRSKRKDVWRPNKEAARKELRRFFKIGVGTKWEKDLYVEPVTAKGVIFDHAIAEGSEDALREMKTIRDLPSEVVEEIRDEMIHDGTPVRFMDGGQAVDISTGEMAPKGSNVMHHPVYWKFTKATSKKIGKLLGLKPVFDKGEVNEARDLPSYRVFLDNDTDYVTSMAADVTLEKATDYFVGKSFEQRDGSMAKALRVEPVEVNEKKK